MKATTSAGNCAGTRTGTGRSGPWSAVAGSALAQKSSRALPVNSSASANNRTVDNRGMCRPLSMLRIVFGSTPALRARLSWEKPAWRRRARNVLPNIDLRNPAPARSSPAIHIGDPGHPQSTG